MIHVVSRLCLVACPSYAPAPPSAELKLAYFVGGGGGGGPGPPWPNARSAPTPRVQNCLDSTSFSFFSFSAQLWESIHRQHCLLCRCRLLLTPSDYEPRIYCMRLIKGCGRRLKTMRLTVKYTLNNEVRLTTGCVIFWQINVHITTTIIIYTCSRAGCNEASIRETFE